MLAVQEYDFLIERSQFDGHIVPANRTFVKSKGIYVNPMFGLRSEWLQLVPQLGKANTVYGVMSANTAQTTIHYSADP